MSSLRCCANAPAPATLFIQLSMLRQIPAAKSPMAPILDLLAPRRQAAASICASARRYTTSARMRTAGPFCREKQWNDMIATRQRPSRILHKQITKRELSTSPPARATHTIFNPQMDEEGKEMKLEITPRAANRLSQIMTKDSNPNLALRIQVESGGCHGFQYLMKLVTLPASLPSTPSSADEAAIKGASEIREDDTIFTYTSDESGEPATDISAPKIILDQPSLDLLKGSKVDFTMELIGSQFKIVDNPLATSSCGCGTSFDIKV
ncbi:hypothetical protein V8F33_005386 [Rhypophila sp. PSN 637]